MLESVGPEILNLKENGKPQKLTILRTCWQKIDNCVDSHKKPQTLILQSHPNYQLLCDERTAWSKQNTHIILFELCATYINLFTLCATFGGNSVVGNLTFITALQICQAMITSFMNRDFCAKLQQISIPFLTQRVACKPELLQTEIASCVLHPKT